MKLAQHILITMTAFNMISFSAHGGGGGSDGLNLFCSSPSLEYSLSVDVEESPISIGKSALILGPFTGFRSGQVAYFDDSLLIVKAPATKNHYAVALEINLNKTTGRAEKLKVTEGYYHSETDQVSCYVQ